MGTLVNMTSFLGFMVAWDCPKNFVSRNTEIHGVQKSCTLFVEGSRLGTAIQQASIYCIYIYR